jgi:diguanylate cyclase (GGDEF)-like protein
MKAKSGIRWFHAFAQPATYLGIITIITILTGAFFLEKEEYERAQEDGIQRASNFARVFEENVSSIFRSTDRQLLFLRQIFEHNPKDLDLVQWANKIKLNSDHAPQFTIIGPDGNILATTFSPNAPATFVGDREYFQVHVNSSTDELFIGPPVIGRLSRTTTIQLSRRLTASDGSFGGVVLASLDVLDFQKLLNSIDVGRDGSISLIGFDGIIRARSSNPSFPTAEDKNGRLDPNSKLFQSYRQSAQGYFWDDDAPGHQPDGIRRLSSYRALEDLRLLTVVGIADLDIFKRAREHARVGWSKALFFAGAILIAISIAAARERKLILATSELSYRARHDLLTGLANRQAFVDELERSLAEFRAKGEKFNVLMLDLDRFKNVNDLLGHPAGDALLKEMANRLKSSLHEDDLIARLGGDEFAIIQRCKIKSGNKDSVEGVQRQTAITLALQIVSRLEEPFEIEGNKINVGTSIGIALTQNDNTDSSELMKWADLALYSAKAQERSSYVFFDRAMMAEIEARQRIELELRNAISSDELELHYQQIIDVTTRRTCSIEALARWRHPRRGLIGPYEFIPIAEATNLIVPLGKWVLQRACTDATHWPENIKVVVNLSAVQFKKSDLVADICCALLKSGLPAQRLEVDITESTLSDDDGRNLETLHKLKKLGVTITLDDFGTGYSSLNNLTVFPFDKIKIDRSFTLNMTRNPACAAVIATVITLGRCLDILTTAEGVESRQEYESLRVSGINFVQGFLFGPPRPASELRFDDFYIHKLIDDDCVTAAN